MMTTNEDVGGDVPTITTTTATASILLVLLLLLHCDIDMRKMQTWRMKNGTNCVRKGRTRSRRGGSGVL